MSDVIELFGKRRIGGSAPENSDGSPTATGQSAQQPAPPPEPTLAQQLRVMADQLEKNPGDHTTALVILLNRRYTDTPYIFGAPLSSSEVIGRLEIAKVATLDAIMLGDDER